MNSKDATVTQDGVETTPPRAIALMNQKGGVGKTTTTVNLGAAFAQAGKRVLLVDLDPQAHLTLHLGVELNDDQPSAYDLLVDLQTTFEQVVVSRSENLDVVPSETDLAAAELELSARPGREFILGNKLANHLSSYDIVLFDCPPSLGILTLNALATAHEVFVPMQAHFLPLQGVGKLLETVGLVTENVNADLRVTAIVLCAHENQTTLSREIVADLKEFFENSRDQQVAWRSCRILEPAVRRNIKLAEAPSFGQTIFEYSNECNGAADYRALAGGLLQSWWPDEQHHFDVPLPRQSGTIASESDAELEEELVESIDESNIERIAEPSEATVQEESLAETVEATVANIPPEIQIEVKPVTEEPAPEPAAAQMETSDQGHSWARPWETY